jgi:hypothetical protein
MKKHENVTAEVTYHDEINKWERPMTEWKIELEYQGRQFQHYFYTGIAITAEPTATAALEALFADAATLEYVETFEEWCAELGYNPDSITDNNTYQDCIKNAEGLRHLLGKDYKAISDELDTWS